MKYRIYDKEEKAYCEEPDWRWMLSRDGKLYNSENDKWHTPGERYIIEFWTGEKDSKGIDIYDGDIFTRGKSDTKYWLRNGKHGWLGYSDEGDKYGVFTSSIYHNNGYDQKNNYITVVGNKHGKKVKHYQY